MIHSHHSLIQVKGELAQREGILLVDDDEFSRAAFSSFLGQVGYDIRAVKTVDEAATAAIANPVRVVVTDLHMPHGGAQAVVERLHQIIPQALYVILTGDSNPSVPTGGAMDTQISSIVQKRDCDALIGAIEQALRLQTDVAAQQRETSQLTLLLLEDDQKDADLTQVYLRNQSEFTCEVVWVRRLREAKSQLRQKRFDLIITDLTLPDARGIDAVVRMRALNDEVPIIALTSGYSTGIARTALREGAQDCLMKSALSPTRLSSAIHQAIVRKEDEALLRDLANLDTLTGLFNRRCFMEKLRRCVCMTHRTAHPLALAFIDLDGFKQINDTIGHDVGDSILCAVASRLKSVLRETDTIARLGGDEFVILLENTDDVTRVEQVVQRLFDAIKAPIPEAMMSVAAMSVGVVLDDGEAPTAEHLLHAADQAMYLAKRSGRNQFHIADFPFSEKLALA